MKNRTKLFILFFISLNKNIFALGASQNSNYPKFCQEAAANQELFCNFRQHQSCKEIVETLGYGQALDFLHEIEFKYPHLLQYFKTICAEDNIGNPIQYSFPTIGTCSATILRYVKVVGDLQKEFGDLSNLEIYEIGAGYGGQCKILHTITGFKRYTLIDIPECTPLIKKYLQCFDIKNISIISNNSLDKVFYPDLIISNYAFSEIDREEQLLYFEKVIKHAQRGYMIYNQMQPINPLTIDEFVQLLSSYDKKVKILAEDPARTGDIVIWHS